MSQSANTIVHLLDKTRDLMKRIYNVDSDLTMDFKDGVAAFDMADQKARMDFYHENEAVISHLWHIKDHAKAWYKENGLPEVDVETSINNDRDMCIIGDLANIAKHGVPLRHARSPVSPRLGKLMPYVWVRDGKFRFKPDFEARTFTIVAHHNSPHIYTIEVVDGAGSRIGDVCKLGMSGLGFWQQLLGSVNFVMPSKSN